MNEKKLPTLNCYWMLARRRFLSNMYGCPLWSWNCPKSNLGNRYLCNIFWGVVENLRFPLKFPVYLLVQLSRWLQKWPQACAHFWLKPMVFLLPANISRQRCFELHLNTTACQYIRCCVVLNWAVSYTCACHIYCTTSLPFTVRYCIVLHSMLYCSSKCSPIGWSALKTVLYSKVAGVCCTV